MTPPPAASAARARPAARVNAARAALQPARRRSGPVPQKAIPARPAPVPRGARPRALAQAGAAVVLDRLLRGRAWVVCVGVLLVGIVFLNVALLELNKGITRNSDRTADLKRDNAELRLKVARLGSSERIQRMAVEKGLVLPLPGRVRYKRPRAGDSREALRTMTEPRERPVAAAPGPGGAGAPGAGAPGPPTGQPGPGRPAGETPAAQAPATQGAGQTTAPGGAATGGAGQGAGTGTGGPATGGAGRAGGGAAAGRAGGPG